MLRRFATRLTPADQRLATTPASTRVARRPLRKSHTSPTAAARVPVKIGAGTFGRVFRPSIPCRQSNAPNNRYVSKVAKATNIEEELRIIRLLQTVPGHKDLMAPGVYEACPYIESNVVSRFPTLASEVAANNSEALRNAREILQMPYGGLSLTQTTQIRHEMNSRGIRAAEVIKSFKRLLVAMARMHSKGIAHGDIKSDNVVWMPQTNRFYLIDFGYTHKFGEYPASYHNPRHVTYRYWAPEAFVSIDAMRRGAQQADGGERVVKAYFDNNIANLRAVGMLDGLLEMQGINRKSSNHDGDLATQLTGIWMRYIHEMKTTLYNLKYIEPLVDVYGMCWVGMALATGVLRKLDHADTRTVARFCHGLSQTWFPARTQRENVRNKTMKHLAAAITVRVSFSS